MIVACPMAVLSGEQRQRLPAGPADLWGGGPVEGSRAEGVADQADGRDEGAESA